MEVMGLLRALKQSKTEPVAAYAERFRELCDLAEQQKDNYVEHFIEGLRPKIKQLTRFAAPETFWMHWMLEPEQNQQLKKVLSLWWSLEEKSSKESSPIWLLLKKPGRATRRVTSRCPPRSSRQAVNWCLLNCPFSKGCNKPFLQLHKFPSQCSKPLSLPSHGCSSFQPCHDHFSLEDFLRGEGVGSDAVLSVEAQITFTETAPSDHNTQSKPHPKHLAHLSLKTIKRCSLFAMKRSVARI